MEILLELTKFYDVNMHLDNIIMARLRTIQIYNVFVVISISTAWFLKKTPHFSSMIPTNPQQSQLKTFITPDAESPPCPAEVCTPAIYSSKFTSNI